MTVGTSGGTPCALLRLSFGSVWLLRCWLCLQVADPNSLPFHFSDLHEQLHPVKRKIGNKDVEFGVDRLIGGLKAARTAAGPGTLVLYAGDAIRELLSRPFQGEVTFGLLDGVIYMVPGVHDFDYGQDISTI